MCKIPIWSGFRSIYGPVLPYIVCILNITWRIIDTSIICLLWCKTTETWVYSINNKSIYWFNLEYLCNRWSDSCGVFSICLEWKNWETNDDNCAKIECIVMEKSRHKSVYTFSIYTVITVHTFNIDLIITCTLSRYLRSSCVNGTNSLLSWIDFNHWAHTFLK